MTPASNHGESFENLYIVILSKGVVSSLIQLLSRCVSSRLLLSSGCDLISHTVLWSAIRVGRSMGLFRANVCSGVIGGPPAAFDDDSVYSGIIKVDC